MNAIIHHLEDVSDVSDFLLRHGVLDVLPQGFSEKIWHTMKMNSWTVIGFMTVFADGLTAMGNDLAVMNLPEGSIICNDFIDCNESLSDSNIAFSEKLDAYLVNKFNQVS